MICGGKIDDGGGEKIDEGGGEEGRGRRRRPKRRWMDSVNVDLREMGLSGEEASI